MKTNKELLEVTKAVISTGTGGIVPAQSVEGFIKLVVDQVPLLTKISTYSDIAKSATLDTIGVASRLLRKAVEGVAPDNVAGATIGKRTLTPEEVLLPYDITFSFLEKNIEKEKAEQILNELFGLQFGTDGLDLSINGDTTSGDPFILILDGWIRKIQLDADVHRGTFLPEANIFETLDKLILQLPKKYRKNKENRIFMSPDREFEYRTEWTKRNSALGDSALTLPNPFPYKGYEIETVNFFEDTDFLLTPLKNLAIGYGRSMKVGRQVQERKRIIEYTITAEMDANYKISDAISYLAEA